MEDLTFPGPEPPWATQPDYSCPAPNQTEPCLDHSPLIPRSLGQVLQQHGATCGCANSRHLLLPTAALLAARGSCPGGKILIHSAPCLL